QPDIREGYASILRLQSRKRSSAFGTAKKRGAGLFAIWVGVIALRKIAGAAVGTGATRDGRADDDAISWGDVSYLLTRFFHDSHAFMAQNRSRRHARNCAAYQVQIRAADCAGGQMNDGIVIILDTRLSHIIEANIANSVEYKRFHEVPSFA